MRYLTSTSDEGTLYLPRILCLHGGGTNARIFRAQCRVLERALQPSFRLCYAEASLPSSPGPDVGTVYHGFGPFRAWIDPEIDISVNARAIQTAIRNAIEEDNKLGATGRFVGLLGFSQGAKICASLLIEQQVFQGGSTERNSNIMPEWRFAVLLAGRGPLVTLSTESVDRWRTQNSSTFTARELIRIPTIHVHGSRDPGLDLHRKLLYENFDLRCSRVIEWDGEHRVPIKTKDVIALVNEIFYIAQGTGALVGSNPSPAYPWLQEEKNIQVNGEE